MRALRRFLKRLIPWSTGGRDEERLRAEIEEHLASQAEENIRAGMSPAEARLQAVLKFGSLEATRESYRDHEDSHPSKPSCRIRATCYGGCETRRPLRLRPC